MYVLCVCDSVWIHWFKWPIYLVVTMWPKYKFNSIDWEQRTRDRTNYAFESNFERWYAIRLGIAIEIANNSIRTLVFLYCFQYKHIHREREEQTRIWNYREYVTFSWNIHEERNSIKTDVSLIYTYIIIIKHLRNITNDMMMSSATVRCYHFRCPHT